MEKTMTIAGLMHAAAFWALIIALWSRGNAPPKRIGRGELPSPAA